MVVMSTLDLARSSAVITGGSDGIGLALAARFLARGTRVLVTGRSTEKLARAQASHPGLATVVSDVANPDDRARLAGHARDANILVNNAGIMRRVGLAEDHDSFRECQREIDTLLAGPMHLCRLFVPQLLAHARASLVVNITSGGAFVPQPFAPTYSACKAGLHSFTMNLRFALADTNVRVVEVIPPAVRTSLADGATAHGAPLDAFADAVFAALTAPRPPDEIAYGATASPAIAEHRAAARQLFDALCTRFPVATFR